MTSPVNALLRAALLAVLVVTPGVAQPSAALAPHDEALAAALRRAGDHAAELRAAIDRAPAEQRHAIEFLVANMPVCDLRSLSADFLVDDVARAFTAWRGAPWAEQVPEDVFLDAILPYANLTETREAWRADLRERCLPLVDGCTSPADAAQRINQKLFAALGVRYSTERRRADQSPSETIAQGLASCSGLSILLVDACRSVGVPARIAGIPEWPNKPGNHTWVEVWDGERWHFTGAAEYDPKGLDHAWFVGDAALATNDDPRHAIWAVVWRNTGSTFPIAWDDDAVVHAVDVTDRYAKPRQAAAAVRLMIDVRDGDSGARVAAKVELLPASGEPRTGTAKGEHADTNDHLEFAVARGSTWTIHATFDGRSITARHTCGDGAQEFVTLTLSGPDDDALRAAAAAYFAASPEERPKVAFEADVDALVGADEAAARQVVWSAYRDAPIHADERAQFDAHVVRTADRESPYTVKQIGERPAHGFPLFIAMHGGGGVAKAVNDQQWSVMQVYYKDHPELGGYRYVALRAPNDAWNGFYDDAICPLVTELIRQFLLFGDVDPTRCSRSATRTAATARS